MTRRYLQKENSSTIPVTFLLTFSEVCSGLFAEMKNAMTTGMTHHKTVKMYTLAINNAILNIVNEVSQSIMFQRFTSFNRRYRSDGGGGIGEYNLEYTNTRRSPCIGEGFRIPHRHDQFVIHRSSAARFFSTLAPAVKSRYEYHLTNLYPFAA